MSWLGEHFTAIMLGFVFAFILVTDVYGFYALQRMSLRPRLPHNLIDLFRRAPLAERIAMYIGLATVFLCAAILPTLSIGKFHLHDLGRLATQPWALPSILSAAEASFIAALLAAIVLSARSTMPKISKAVTIANVMITAFLLAVLYLALLGPPAEFLSSLEGTLSICAVAMIYAIFAFGSAMQNIPVAIRVGLLLLILSPVYQPLSTYRVIESIRADRYSAESSDESFRDPHSNNSFNGLLFFVPDSLHTDESTLVSFDASHDGKFTKTVDCLTPSLVAPGFSITAINDRATSGSSPQVRWQWIVIPNESGRRFLALNILSAPCQGSKRAADRSDVAFSTIDSMLVARPWYSPDSIASLSSSATAIVGIFSVVVGLFGFKKS